MAPTDAIVLRDAGDETGIVVMISRIGHRIDIDIRAREAIAQCVETIGGEGRQTTAPGQKVSDQGDSTDFLL